MQGDEKATQYIQQVMQAAEQGDQEASQVAQMIQAVIQQMQGQQVQAARFGAKLNYIKQLRGQCPDGYEMGYYKAGGKTFKKCKKCEAKHKKMQEGGETPTDSIDAFKCGYKMEKAKSGMKTYTRSGYNIDNDEYSDTTFIKKNGKEQIVKIVNRDETGVPRTTYYENGKPKRTKADLSNMQTETKKNKSK